MLGEMWVSALGCGGRCGKVLGRCGEMLGEVWKVCWGVEKVRGDVRRSVGVVEKLLRCGGRCWKVCGRGNGVWELKCGEGVGKCLGV